MDMTQKQFNKAMHDIRAGLKKSGFPDDVINLLFKEATQLCLDVGMTQPSDVIFTAIRLADNGLYGFVPEI